MGQTVQRTKMLAGIANSLSLFLRTYVVERENSQLTPRSCYLTSTHARHDMDTPHTNTHTKVNVKHFLYVYFFIPDYCINLMTWERK